MSELAAERKRALGHHSSQTTTRSTHSQVDVDTDAGRFAGALIARIRSTKSRLLEGGLLREVEWGVVVPVTPPDIPDPRGRKTFTYSTLDVLIEQRPGLDRASSATDRDDNTVLIILDPVAISDTDTFRFGDPIHVYKVKKIDGLLQDAEAGTRFFTEVTVIR